MAAQINHDANAGSVVIMEKTDKRDYLIDIEKRVRADWQQAQHFETNAPGLPAGIQSYADFFAQGYSMQQVQKEHPKWFGTFPYPYMNGSLHLGHAFTISKVEFAAGFERLRGKNVLFPLGYHATGMPIKTSADKLIREMEMFGPNFENFEPEVKEEAHTSSDPSKAKKGKLNAKSTGLSYQFQILDLIGVPREEIKTFADPYHWLHYFPPIAKTDLSNLGARIDWRRQFLTTDANPYYDSFVRWQTNKLHQQGKIKFGERYTVYSPKDGQPCMDHDRSSGEAVGPQEYTAVKLELLQWGPNVPESVVKAVNGRKVTLVAATLRPETMYGQTNCFVGPNLAYGLFEASDSELYLVTERAARNMAFQSAFDRPRGDVIKVVDVKGADVIGSRVRPAFGQVAEVYVLPMDGVLATKGTGVVTSVPSDSPDDYRTLMDLRAKPEYYGIKAEWAAVDPISVLSTPKLGDMAAETLCTQFKIQSQKDTKQLAEAKEIAYKEGFYNGVMTIGEFKGEPVADAKPKVRQQMIDQKLAFAYAEPESEVISRSADVCVVALVDQWYLDYGEEQWKAVAKRLLDQMNTYLPETRNNFEAVLDWLNQWACARSYGLGSKLPWDPQFLVESLSDSTIYMSYYTVANLLHNDMWGKEPGPLGVKPEHMTDAMWDYVLGSGEFPKHSELDIERAAQLKYSFQYFYPMDLRSSGKDLIPNHLTFCIYVHAALFPEHHWPRSIRTNGHLTLNGKKMSKSTGNFLTMEEATRKYGADAMRLTLADAGDEITDANFEETVANAAILRLHTASLWAKEIKADDTLRSGEFNSFDQCFQAEMNALIKGCYEAFEKMEYKAALKCGLYDFEIARNWYRTISSAENGGEGMHRDLVFDWIRSNALMLAPFTPHFSEHIWQDVLGETTSVQQARFPQIKTVDAVALARNDYMRGAVDSLRSAEALISRRKGKAKAAGFDTTKPKSARIFVAESFPQWQEEAIAVLKSCMTDGTVDDAALKKQLATSGLIKDKRIMPFCQQIKRQVIAKGEAAFDRSLPFSEMEALKAIRPYIMASLKYQDCEIVTVKEALERIAQEGESAGLVKDRAEASEPGTPSSEFWNI